MSRLNQLLAELVSHRTVNPGGDERVFAGVLADRLRAFRPDAIELLTVPGEQPHSSVVASWGTPRLLVNAHLDTVPVNPGWSGDPFTLRRVEHADGPRLVALGAADTKGAIAAVLDALHDGPPRDTAILFSGDEERTNRCMKPFLATPHARQLTRAIVCEPTGLRVGTRHRGIISFEVRLAGLGGHSSQADHQPAPVAELARVAVGLHEFGRQRRDAGPPGFPGLCLNIAKLDGGVAFNVIPSSANLWVSVRPAPGADVAALQAELAALVHDLAPAADVRWGLANPPFASEGLELFRPLLEAAVDHPVDLGFWTEAALIGAAGIATVVVGPGVVSQAHAPDEWVAEAELAAARDLFARVFAATRVAEA